MIAETGADSSLSILSMLRKNVQLFPSKRLYTFLLPNKASAGNTSDMLNIFRKTLNFQTANRTIP